MGGKKPRHILSISDDKVPRTAFDDPGEMKKRPAWRFSELDMAGPWGWHSVNCDEFQNILIQLASTYERLTWHEIIHNDNTGSHEIPTKECCKDARDRLIDIHLDDHDTLFSMRITKTKRLWGIREGRVLRVLWWDPEHTVYPMNVTDN